MHEEQGRGKEWGKKRQRQVSCNNSEKKKGMSKVDRKRANQQDNSRVQSTGEIVTTDGP